MTSGLIELRDKKKADKAANGSSGANGSKPEEEREKFWGVDKNVVKNAMSKVGSDTATLMSVQWNRTTPIP